MKKLSLSTLIILSGMILQAQSFTFMTYNIRYANPGDGVNYWENRRAELANQIAFYEPDVFGIQEGLPEQVEYLDEQLDAYSWYGVGRDDGKSKGEFSAVYYKKDKFSVLKNETFWLSPTPEKPSKGWDAALPRICTAVLFQVKGSDQKFWVFNTHFDHRGDEARLQAVDVILNKLKELNKAGHPAIVMGDLNLTPDTPPIKKLFGALNDTRAVSDLVFGPEGTWSSFDVQKELDRRIDYIVVSDQVKVSKYAVLTDNRDLRNYSDHLPVFIQASFSK
ncbi:MAG: endonuclease/exonuclease/phosphatase family protein [Cyclobacteriaceae bacterium]|nr:endonuclease/exonuclease/phosphatase family protein [Cyclobacteriaceae bacterium SS2]